MPKELKITSLEQFSSALQTIRDGLYDAFTNDPEAPGKRHHIVDAHGRDWRPCKTGWRWNDSLKTGHGDATHKVQISGEVMFDEENDCRVVLTVTSEIEGPYQPRWGGRFFVEHRLGIYPQADILTILDTIIPDLLNSLQGSLNLRVADIKDLFGDPQT